MIPPRLALRVTRELSFAELEARRPRDEKYITAILIRRAGTEGFDWLQAEQGAGPGDDVLVYAIDRTDNDQLNALNKEFDRHYYPPQRGLGPDEHELIATRFPERDASVLEVCCGAGRLTSHLVRDGNRVTGLDFNRHLLAAAHARDGARVDYVLGDATRLPFADGAFDVTCCLENGFGVLFAHVPPTLAQMIRVTRPGGRVIVGLREHPGQPDNLHLYNTRNGLVSVARTFDAGSVHALLEALPAAASDRIVRGEQIAGAPRPWGGSTFYVELLVG